MISLVVDETKNRKKRKLNLEVEQAQLRSKVQKLEQKLSVIGKELNVMTAEDECNNILMDMQSAVVEISEAAFIPLSLAQLICDFQKSTVFHVFLKSSLHAKYLRSLPASSLTGLRVIESSPDWSYGFAEGDEEDPSTTFPFWSDNDDGMCPLEACPERIMKRPFGLAYRNILPKGKEKTNSLLVANIADTVNIHITDWERACNKDKWIDSKLKIDSDDDFYHVHYLIPGSRLVILCYSDFLDAIEQLQVL